LRDCQATIRYYESILEQKCLILHLERQLREMRKTTRQDFAKAALIGVLSSSYTTYKDMTPTDFARDALEIADAMMEIL
jgi:hypothetical protein